MERKIYWGNWEEGIDPKHWSNSKPGYERCRHDFDAVENPRFPKPEDVLFAAYETPSYEGQGIIVFKSGDELFEASDGHCSCNGLSFIPKPVTWDALLIRFDHKFYGEGAEARKALAELVIENTKPPFTLEG